MNLLLYSWNANNEQILADNLTLLGFEVVWFRKECRHYTRDMELAMDMIPFIHEKKIKAVISFNYFPIISMICSICQIPYYAWVYDCPHFTLYAKQMTMSCNHIGIFDRDMVRQLEEYGLNTVYHVPLAVDSEYFNSVIAGASPGERKKYQCDISFVGSLYTGEYNYYDALFSDESSVYTGQGDRKKKEEEISGNIPENMDEALTLDSGIASLPKEGQKQQKQEFIEMEHFLSRQCFSYRKNYLRQFIISGSIDSCMVQNRMETQGLMLGEDYFAKPEDILMSAVLEKKVTVEERRILLTEIVKCFTDQNSAVKSLKETNGKNISQWEYANGAEDVDEKYNLYDFRLYTGSGTGKIPALDAYNCGMVDYLTQMPLVFAGSKINLNISLRSIHSGIPLRVLDIMACGGFVLSNWQPEIEENFKEGVEIVTFENLEDCLDKIAYYLSHEEERKQIAYNGRKRVQEMFSYQLGLGRLFS